jgi:hypothetical protein
MGAGIVTQKAADGLALQLKGLVHVRALLETHGVSPVEIAKHSEAIERLRVKLARVEAAA